MLRALSLRLIGVLAAAIVLVVSAQLLVLGVRGDGGDGLVRDHSVDDAVDWMARTHGEGAEILVGVGLVLLGGWLTWAFVTTVHTSQPAYLLRREGGWTRIDRRSLGASLERGLAQEFRSAECSVRLGRSGRADVKVVTAEEHPEALIESVHAELDRLIRDRGLPCTPGKVVVRRPRPRHTSRVR